MRFELDQTASNLIELDQILTRNDDGGAEDKIFEQKGAKETKVRN